MSSIRTRALNKCFDSSPRINPVLANGLVEHQSKGIERYIDEIIRSASHSFPPGLKYVDCRRATPEEQFRELTRLRRSKRIHELAASDLYHCKYRFEFNGIELKPRYIQLPYIRRGGLIRIRNASFVVSPVLADNVFSVERDQIYMPVSRSKLTFNRWPVTFRANGKLVSVDTVHSPIFNTRKKERHKHKVSLLIHYILARYGLKDGLKKYFGADVVCGYSDINEKDYPANKWVICSSTGVRPNTPGYNHYIPSELKFAIPKKQYNKTMASVMGGIFYIVDHEPDLVVPEQVNGTGMWRRLLARFIKADVGIERKSIEEMNSHIDSVDDYMDDLVRRRLKAEGIPCDTIYSVFAHMLETFSDRTLECDPANMFDKRLESIPFLMYDVVYWIFTLMFELVKLTGERLNTASVERAFDLAFPTNEILKINRMHGEVATLESATDFLPLAVTKTLVPQSKANVIGRGSKGNEMNDPAFALHPSQCAVGTYLFITKSDPSARSAINHFLEIDDVTGAIKPNPAQQVVLDNLGKLLYET